MEIWMYDIDFDLVKTPAYVVDERLLRDNLEICLLYTSDAADEL